MALMNQSNSQQVNVAFNFDSTLVTIEGPVVLAQRKGMDAEQVARIMEDALNSDESFRTVFERRFELYRPSLSDIAWLSDQYAENIVPGAKEAIDALKAMGCRIFIVSASYRPAILKTARALGISALGVCAVDLEFTADGQYRSYDADNVLITDEGQGMVLAEIGKSGPVIFVADAVRDLRQQSVVDCFIGFGGVRYNEIVKKKADTYIEGTSLGPVVDAVQTFMASYQEGHGTSLAHRDRVATTHDR